MMKSYGLVLVGCALLSAPEALHGQDAGAIPTFSKDVAPILQQSCQRCHNPEGIGPMPLTTYEEVRPWAPVIRERVVTRVMPPWHVDPTVGIQEYKDDFSLSREQIETIARWADNGAPRGNPADLPPPIAWPSGGEWQLAATLGPPDLIIESTPYDVVADGQDQWWNPVLKFEGLDRERWLKAAEFKPAHPLGVKVVHHGHAVLDRPGERSTALARYGVGKSWEMFPDGIGLRVAPEGQVSWDLHYFPVGEEVPDDVVQVGLWFYPDGQEPRVETAGEVMFRVDDSDHPRGQDILIPPHGYQVLQSAHVLEEAALIHSFRPHLHMRGKTMTMEAIYPDGRKEVLTQVDNYKHTWQLAYLYEDHVRPLLPKGTVLLFTTVFDNTANNPLNPDPDQWVVFGRRGVDEMSHAWVGITFLDDDEYVTMAAERERDGEGRQSASATR